MSLVDEANSAVADSVEVDSTVAKAPRPGWVGFRWGAAAMGLFALLGGLLLGFFAVIWDAGADFTLAEALPTFGIFLLPSLIGGILFGGIGGAITMRIIFALLKRMEGASRGRAALIALGVCLALMFLFAAPVLALLYSDGNFWRGLEESMIVAIPFYFLPGIFYIVAMAWGTLRNFARWFPGRVAASQ